MKKPKLKKTLGFYQTRIEWWDKSRTQQDYYRTLKQLTLDSLLRHNTTTAFKVLELHDIAKFAITWRVNNQFKRMKEIGRTSRKKSREYLRCQRQLVLLRASRGLLLKELNEILNPKESF